VTLVLTSGSGGVLVHAATLAQEGDVVAYKNLSARVRVAAGATGNAAVTASVAGQTLASGQRAPSVGGYRLVNALAGQDGGLTLNVNYSAVAIEVEAGAASDATSLTAVNDVPLEVISPLAAAPLYAIAEADLVAKAVYTVFMLGSSGAPYGMLRKDR
jgi:hypothetical protein